MFEHVVVGIRDDDSGRDAIALAKELVSPQGGLMLLYVHVVAPKPAPDSGSVGDAAKSRYALERLTALAAELSVDARLWCEQAQSVRRGLHEFALRQHADLLVVRASHYDELAREFIGDDTREVLEDAPCAVAVAPVGYSARAAAVTRIGVAFDGSAESERALALARKLAAERHGELSGFEAVGMPLYVRDPWDVRGVEIDEQVEQARQQIAALGGVQPHAEFAEDTVEGLMQYGASVDLLVIGSHRYRPLDRFLGQSTSQRLADEASSPLLVLPSSAHAGE
jgi:nucleotide-binding universal stress UspA family protein